MTLLASIDTPTLMLPLAATACFVTLYLCMRIRRTARQRVWQRRLAEENRLRKM